MDNAKLQTNVITWLLFIGTAYVKMASYMCLPFLAIYLVKFTSASPILTGIVIAAAPLAALLGGFFGGHLSDHIPRANIILISLLGSGICIFAFYLALTFKNEFTFILLIMINALYGFVSSLFPASCQALLSDLTAQNEKSFVYQQRYAAINIGAALGPMIGVVLGITAAKSAFLITSGLYMIYFFILYVVFKYLPIAFMRPAHASLNLIASLKILSRDNRMIYFLLAGILFNACCIQVESTLPQHLALIFNNGSIIYSYLLTLACVTFLLAQIPAYYLSKYLKPSYQMILGIFISTFGFLIFALGQDLIISFYVGIVLITVGETCVFPIASYYIDCIAPKNLRGTYFGAGMLRQLGFAIGPIMGGYFLQNYGSSVLFLVVACITVLSGLLQYFGQYVSQADLKSEVLASKVN